MELDEATLQQVAAAAELRRAVLERTYEHHEEDRESAELQRQLWEERAKASREKVMAAGVKFNDIPDKSAFQNAMKPVYDTYLSANPDLVPLVELIQNTD